MAGRRPIGRNSRENGRPSLLADFGDHNFSRRWPVVSDGRPRAGGGSAFKPEQAERCQTKASSFAQPHNRQISGRKLTPLCQGGGTIEFEVFAIVMMAFLIEMIVD